MEKLKKTIGSLGIVGALAGGAVGLDDTFTKRIHLESTNKNYSNFEYRQERKNIGNKGSADDLDWNGLELYVEVLNKEKDKCNGDMYLVKNKQDIRNLVKKFDSDGCP